MGLGRTGLGSSSGGINFSTSEQDTGLKWIDGKTIYQKTIDIGALPNATTKNIAHGITGLDLNSVKVLQSGTGAGNGSLAITLPFVETNSAADCVRLSFNSTNVQIISSVDYSSYSGHVTIQYTKT